MRKSGWYLIAYDITEPRRLRRLHQCLRKQGIPMQQSVFLVRRDTREIEDLMNELNAHIDRRHDDLRAYPVPVPGDIWLRGQRALDGPVLLPGGGKPNQQPALTRKRGLWSRLTRRQPSD